MRDASRNPRHCCPIIPENTRNTIVFFNTVSSLGSLKISIKFLKPTNFIACAELPVSEMSVKEKKTVMIMGPMKKTPSSKIDGEKKVPFSISFVFVDFLFQPSSVSPLKIQLGAMLQAECRSLISQSHFPRPQFVSSLTQR